MKKILMILLAILTVCSLAACSTKEPAATEATKPTRPTYENADEYVLTFTNEGMSVELSWDRLSAVIAGKHKDATMMSEAIAQNKEYTAALVQLSIGVYNYENTDDPGLKTTIQTNSSLLDEKNITVCTQKIENSSYIGDKYPAERLHQMLRMGYEKYGIQMTGVYKIGYGDVSSEYTFKLYGKVKFEDKTDSSKLPAGKLVLTDTGAELTVNYEELIQKVAISDLSNETLEIMAPFFYTSKQEMRTGTMEILKYEFTTETRPEKLLVKMKYDRAWNNNTAIYDEYLTVGQEMYIELPISLYNGENEYAYTVMLRVDVESQLSETEPVDANPMTEVTWEQSYVKLDDAMPFILYAPTGVELTANTPMIIWLHGSGECGASEATYLTRGLPAVLDTWELKEFNAYIVCPIAQGSTWANPSYVDDLQAIIDYMAETYPINVKNVSLAGHSLGGIGVQYFGGKMPNTFSRIAVLSGYSCDQLENITVPIKGWVGRNGEDGSSYAYMMRADIQEKMATTVIDCGHGALPQQVFTIDENQDGFSDVMMWLCGVE